MNVVARALNLGGRGVLIREEGGPISVQEPLPRWQAQGSAMLAAEHKMKMQFEERWTHADSRGTPLQGWRFEAGPAS